MDEAMETYLAGCAPTEPPEAAALEAANDEWAETLQRSAPTCPYHGRMMRHSGTTFFCLDCPAELADALEKPDAK
jgi:hypothetical protein